MKLLVVVPKSESGANLKSMLDTQERELRGGRTTFLKISRNKWKHAKYYGWINVKSAAGGILIAEVESNAKNTERQLLQAFVGYIERHFYDQIDSMNITFR